MKQQEEREVNVGDWVVIESLGSDDNGVVDGYLTMGKEYQVVDCDDGFIDILDDEDEGVYGSMIDCYHLGGGNWRVVRKAARGEQVGEGDSEEMVTITKKAHDRLLERLGCLEEAGVDNWEGIGYAYEIQDEYR